MYKHELRCQDVSLVTIQGFQLPKTGNLYPELFIAAFAILVVSVLTGHSTGIGSFGLWGQRPRVVK